jgi:hypothetical protein
MENVDLEAGLRGLRHTLQQIKDLLAWEQLKKSEKRPGQPPSLQIHDPTETDLRDEYSFFLYTSVQMHSVLNDGSSLLSESERQSIKRRLARIEQQVYNLNLHQRFCGS